MAGEHDRVVAAPDAGSATVFGSSALDAAGLQILGRDECLWLLGHAAVGRIGLSVGALPVILPVRFRLDGERILIRTHPGTTLDAATRDAVVAFEADDSDDVLAWSVLVTGVARHVPLTADGPPSTAGLPPWSADRPDRIVAISTDRLSGRRGLFPRATGGEAGAVR